MKRISYQNLFAKLSVAVVLATVAYIVCLTPTVAHAQSPSRFNPAEIAITNANTPFYQSPAGIVAFTVARSTIVEVQYFEAPVVVNGEVWRKLRVADGHYGYVREALLDKYTGTVPTIWLEIDFAPSQVHLNYTARKLNFDAVINQGVVYINPNSDTIRSNDTTQTQPTPTPTPTPTEQFKGGEIVITSKNAAYYDSPNGNQKFVVAKGSLTEVLYFYEPKTVNGKTWYKLRVADGNWGYVTSDSIAKYTDKIPDIWLEFDYQPTKVHLNYEARKKNPDIVINQGVVYINPDRDSIENNDTTEVEDDQDEGEEGENSTEDDTEEEVDNEKVNQQLMRQIISLLQELLKLKMQLMQMRN